MAETNTSNIGFEKQIWDAACVLRGNIDASEYKSVVLGLIFLKYISDRFEAKYQEHLLPRATALKKTRTNTRRRISSLYRKTQDGASYPLLRTRLRLAQSSTRPCGALRRKTSGSKTSSPKTLPALSWISGGSVKSLISSPTFR